MHGSFSRGDTFNNMAAIGPDFKQGYTDRAPVSNADITPTVAQILGLTLPSNGALRGRVLTEALAGVSGKLQNLQSEISASSQASGAHTVLVFQNYNGVQYFDAACLLPSGVPSNVDNTTVAFSGPNPCQ
jgi:arylsulfatase A-like enzyme